MEKVAGVVGIALSLLALGSAFESFTTIGLLPKLLVTAAATVLVVFSAARWFARRLRPANEYIGGGLPEPEPSIRRLLAFSLCLAALCVFFIWLALFLTQRFTLRLSEMTGADKSATLLIAPDVSVETVTIELPRKEEAACDWANRSGGELPPLAVQMIGWNSPTPQLHIDDFVYPQRVEIDCKPPRGIRAGIILPARTVIYLADTLRRIQIAIIVVGAVIWLIACCAIWGWSE